MVLVVKNQDKTDSCAESEQEIPSAYVVPIPAPDFGTRISAMVSLVGSRGDAAKVGGASTTSIQRYIAQSVSAPFDVLARIAFKTGVSLDWLSTAVGPMKPGDAPVARPVKIDKSILYEAIFVLENALQERGMLMTPGQKADLISNSYEVLAAVSDDGKRKEVVEGLKQIFKSGLRTENPT